MGRTGRGGRRKIEEEKVDAKGESKVFPLPLHNQGSCPHHLQGYKGWDWTGLVAWQQPLLH